MSEVWTVKKKRLKTQNERLDNKEGIHVGKRVVEAPNNKGIGLLGVLTNKGDAKVEKSYKRGI